MAYRPDMKIISSLQKSSSERTQADLDILYNYLHQLECCQHLREAALRHLCEVGRYESYPENSIVYRCGDVATCWYVLLAGSVITDQLMFTARHSFGEKQSGTMFRTSKCLTLEHCQMIAFDYEASSVPLAADETDSQQLLYFKRMSRHLSDTSIEWSINDSFLNLGQRHLVRRENQLNSTLATSSETSSVCSSRSAVPLSSDGATDEEQMSTLRPDSRRGFDYFDLSGLEESTVDSDEEDISSVNTESVNVADTVRECLEKPPSDRTDDDIETILSAIQHLQAFSNLTMTTRRALCSAMIFAPVLRADTIVMTDGEELDSWCVVLNGHVEVVRHDGRIEQLQLGDSFGVTATTDKQHHDGIMYTKVDDCQFVCIPQQDYCRILHEGEENMLRLSENGELVLVTEQLVCDGQNQRQRIILRGTPEKLIEHLKYDGDGIDTYVEDFLLTYRSFVKTTRDVTSHLLEWCGDHTLRDKVVSIVLEWINNHFSDFETDANLSEFLEQLEALMEKQHMKQLRLLNVARTAKARRRTVVLNRATRDEVLRFSVLGGTERGCGLFVTKVEKGSKADIAGLKRGDQILDVNNQNFEKISHNRALDILRGSTHLSITVKFNAVGFKEMLAAPADSRPGKKHSKHSTSSLASSSNQLSVPVIASSARGTTVNHRDDMSLSGGHKAGGLRRAFAKFNLLPLNTHSDANQLKGGGKSTASLSAGVSPLLKTRLSSSHPDLSKLQLLQPDDRPNYPEHCLKVFRSDHSCRYLLIHKETTAHEVVMLALREFGSSESSSKYILCEVTVNEGVVKQRRLPDELNNLADRCSFFSRYYIKDKAQTEPLLPDSMLDDIVRESQLHFLQLNCVELVTQLTLRDLQCFRDIQQSEYVIDLFKLHSANKSCRTTHLDAFTELSNDEMFWVVTEVCSEQNIARRAKIVKHFIQIAKHCMEYNNFNSMFAIISGLGHGSVTRLRQTWDRVPSKWIKLFESLEDLMDPSRNMAKYRNLISQENVRPPVIPFFPLVKKDLTFIHLGNDSTMEDLVNFEKLRMIAKEVRRICGMAPVCCDLSVSVSGAALLRKQASGSTVTSNPRKMFDESQMVRRVRAYLASIKPKLITDEAHLSEMSARCEAPVQHPAQQPGANAVRRQEVVVNTGSEPAGHVQTQQSMFGADSLDSARKMLALSAGARPSDSKRHQRPVSTQSYAPSPPQTPSVISYSPSSVKSCPANTNYDFSIRGGSGRRLHADNAPNQLSQKESDSALNSQSSYRSSSCGSTESVQSQNCQLPVPPRRTRPPNSPRMLRDEQCGDDYDDDGQISAV